MRFGDGFKLACQGLKRRKGRTFLTALAVAIGTMLVVTMVSIGISGEKLILSEVEISQLKTTEVYNYKYFDDESTDSDDIDNDMIKKIDDNTVKKLSGIYGVEKATAFSGQSVDNVIVNGKTKKDSILLTASKDNKVVYNEKKGVKTLISGRNLNASDKNSVVLGEKYLKSLGIKDCKSIVGKNITITQNQTQNKNINLKPIKINAKVVGIINEKLGYGNSMWASIDIVSKVDDYYYLQNNYLKAHGYDYVEIQAKDINYVESINKSIKKMDYYYSSYQQIVEKIKSSFKIVEVALSILGIIVLIVASFGIVNTMVMVIYERTKSIGIMKSVGANRRDIHSIFIVQSALIGFMGGIMGIIFSMANLKIIQFGLKMYMENQKIDETIVFNMPFSLAIGTLAFSIGISIIAGIYPSRKASKMDPIKALNS